AERVELEDVVVPTDRRVAFDDAMRADLRARAYLHARADDGVRADFDRAVEFGGGINDGGGMNAGHGDACALDIPLVFHAPHRAHDVGFDGEFAIDRGARLELE